MKVTIEWFKKLEDKIIKNGADGIFALLIENT